MTSKHSEPAFSDLTSSGQAPCASAWMTKIGSEHFKVNIANMTKCQNPLMILALFQLCDIPILSGPNYIQSAAAFCSQAL
jgi:hypothetical protein